MEPPRAGGARRRRARVRISPGRARARAPHAQRAGHGRRVRTLPQQSTVTGMVNMHSTDGPRARRRHCRAVERCR
eukprot:9416296-Pyramimonas_sp.AAC.1